MLVLLINELILSNCVIYLMTSLQIEWKTILKDLLRLFIWKGNKSIHKCFFISKIFQGLVEILQGP